MSYFDVIEVIYAGGQSGADRAGLDVAIDYDIPHSGFCPKGRRAEDGIIPTKYNLKETAGSGYYERTWLNIRHSDATLIFANTPLSSGSALTVTLCKKLDKPYLIIDQNDTWLGKGEFSKLYDKINDFLDDHEPRILNVAGNRESVNPGIHAKVVFIFETVIF